MAKAAKTLQKKRLMKLADMLLADAKNKKGIKFDLSIVGRVQGEYVPVQGDSDMYIVPKNSRA